MDRKSFLEIYLECMKKMRKRRITNGDSWKTVNMDDLRELLSDHVEKWKKRSLRKQIQGKFWLAHEEFDNLIDVINYCLFIMARLKKENDDK